MCYIFNNWLRL
ncbi:hypothetical protein A3Q56_07303 [Intoshia linei]|uniref:Uncharacterized protein n=1 Tax=Intoshia linei TaxID=1819745 RepID=A0A177ASJ1_9BILA|nr:hypothetical protein A3Q56_07303 [Intoshia linei]